MSQFVYEGRDLEAMAVAPKYHRWILSRFKPYIGRRIAEIGAGSGNFTALLAQERVDELLAVEPSEEMFPLLTKVAEDFQNVQCKKAFFGDIYTDYQNHFDSMVYVNVFEHIEQDSVELSYVHASLKSGGYLCVFVPALPMLFSEYDASVGHFRRYKKKQLRTLVEKAGFEIVDVRYFDILGIAPWYLFFTLGKRKLSAGSAKLYDTVAVPVMRRVEGVVKPPIGKNLLLIAKKK